MICRPIQMIERWIHRMRVVQSRLKRQIAEIAVNLTLLQTLQHGVLLSAATTMLASSAPLLPVRWDLRRFHHLDFGRIQSQMKRKDRAPHEENASSWTRKKKRA